MLIEHLFETSWQDEEGHWKAHKETGFYGSQGAGLIFCAQSTGRFLLAERSTKSPPYHVEQGGTWGVWGGAIDANENPEEAAIREAKEECGYTGAIKMVPLFVFKKGTFRYSNFLGIIKDEFTPHLNWESESFKWCEFGKWPSPLHFGVLKLLSDTKSVNIMKEFSKNI